MAIRKASKKHRFLKIGVGGISGSGKTMGALKVAHGITGDWEKICIIDTENNSADLYSDLGPFDVLPLTDTSPNGYVAAFKEVQEAGYNVMIIDSLSHEWNGKGGAVEIADKITETSRSGNSFQAWGKVTPIHNGFMDSLLQAQIHVIATMRKKSDYVLEVNSKGKQAPRKVGLKNIQKDGTSYEFDVMLDIHGNHHCTVEKDRTSLFNKDTAFMLSADTGKSLMTWAESGEPIKEDIYEETPEQKQHLKIGFDLAGVTDVDLMKDVSGLLVGKPMSQMHVLIADALKEQK